MHHGYPFCSFQIVVVSRLSSPTIDPEATQPRPAAGGTAAGKVHNPWAVLTPSPARLTEVATSKTGDMPSRIMQYRLLRQIGAGGMGVVYLAEDGMLGRQVAIKLMLPTVAAVPEHQDRFLREARAMAALSNDHIVTIHQVGRHADRPFIVMPRLHGRTLEQDLGERGAPPYPEVFRIGREIAIGLHAAHEAGLVHRDIKPSNLWLEDPGRRVKILDFGMARSDARDGHLTQPGVRIGTPLYMSPEQAAGNPVDARSDLYSLGVVLYRMCAGRTPFQGDSNLALLRSIAVDAPQPLAELVPTIPPGLAETIMRLLAKNPADRPDSAIAAAEALEHLPVAGGETPSNFPCLQARPARRRRRQH